MLVFPEAARGTNEGHYPWDLQPESMMTNATVTTVVSANDGQTLALKYKGGAQTIKVKPGTPIVTFAPGDKAGAKVFLGAAKAADGSLTATRLLVGKDGLTPRAGWRATPISMAARFRPIGARAGAGAPMVAQLAPIGRRHDVVNHGPTGASGADVRSA